MGVMITTEVAASKDYAPELNFDFDALEELLYDEKALEIAAFNEAVIRFRMDDDSVIEDSDETTEDDFVYEEPRNRLGRLRAKLGQAATIAFWGAVTKMGDISENGALRREARQEKYAASEDDSRWESVYKTVRRSQEKILGGIALGAAFAAEGGLAYMRIKGVEHTVSPLRYYKVNDTALATDYIFGGRGDPTGQGVIDAMQANGNLKSDTNYIGVDYPATISPVDAGPTLDKSSSMGATAAYDQYQAAGGNDGSDITISGFSEGSIPALQFAQHIADDNGGVLPSNYHLVLNGSPVTTTGFFRSDVAQNPIVKMFLGVAGINPDTGKVPAGAIANYSQNDVWANGAHQSLIGEGVLATDIPYAHVVENANAPHVTWTDSEGVIHNEYDVGVHPFTQEIEAQTGQPIAPGFNNFFQDIVPINNNINGGPLPPPNALAAEHDLALGIDQSTGGTGIPQQIAADIPPQMTNVFQDGLNLVNLDPNYIMDATQNPANAPADMKHVMNDVSQTFNDVSKLFPVQANGSSQNFLNNLTNSNYNFAPISAPVHIPMPAPVHIPTPSPVHIPTPPVSHPVPVAPAHTPTIGGAHLAVAPPLRASVPGHN